jgi:hypothetical protein
VPILSSEVWLKMQSVLITEKDTYTHTRTHTHTQTGIHQSTLLLCQIFGRNWSSNVKKSFTLHSPTYWPIPDLIDFFVIKNISLNYIKVEKVST